METKTGSIQYKLNPLLKNDIVIIAVGSSCNVFPIISSNKYAVNVHFSSSLANDVPEKLLKFKLGIASF